MKSYANDLMDIACVLMKDASAKCSADCYNVRDLDTLRARTEDEGLSFLTITLPTFAKDFDLALAAGEIDSSHFKSFKKCAGLPVFLKGFLSLVFEKHTRRLLDDYDICAVEGIRQIGYAFKKLKISCTENRINKAFCSFAQSEHVFDNPISVDSYDNFVDVSRILWNRLWFNQPINTLIPKHGPGSTADGLKGNKKYLSQQWHERLEPFFPVLDYCYTNADSRRTRQFAENLEFVTDLDEIPVKIIDVPKTLKTPRIIGLEPTCMQFTQQAVLGCIVPMLENDPVTGGHINFSDQTINRDLAIMSSKDRSKATIDMSDASNRVPLDPAIRMFDANPDLQGAILACRSTRAQLPSGEILELKKFASMGSALCFPVEAMYFFTLCVMGLLRYKHFPCDMPHVTQVSKEIFVYGDDIIIPTEAAEVVIDTLQEYYCKVNVRKSFFTGNFRESCGMDAFNGDMVTPTYIRYPIPVPSTKSTARCSKRSKKDWLVQQAKDRSTNASALVSLTETCNHLYERGYWKTSDWLRQRLEKILWRLPVVDPNAGCLGLTSFQGVPDSGTYDDKLQRHTVPAWTVKSHARKDPLYGERSLFKSLLMLERKKSMQQVGHFTKKCETMAFIAWVQPTDKEHLETSTRRGDVTLKRRRINPHVVG